MGQAQKAIYINKLALALQAISLPESVMVAYIVDTCLNFESVDNGTICFLTFYNVKFWILVEFKCLALLELKGLIGHINLPLVSNKGGKISGLQK